MAESPSSALEGGVDWLPALGGARLLRTPTAPGDAPALILRAATGEEHRIEPGPEGRFGRHTDYLVPAGLTWATAFLQWADGTRAAVPTPAIPRGELIEFRSRRPAAPAAPEPATWPSIGSLGPARERAAPAAARPASQDAWTAPPQTGGETQQPVRRPGRDSVLAALAGVRAQLRVVRAAREADSSALATLTGELDAERTAHAVTRGTAATLADALAAARAELAQAHEAVDVARQTGADARAHLASARRDAALARAEVATLRADLAAERAVRARAEAALTEAGSPFLQRVAELDRDVAGLRDQVRLERRAREQAEAAAVAVRRPLEETGRIVADLDAAAAALRATTPVAASPPTAAAASPVAAARARPSRVAAPVPLGRDRRLRQALVELAREDPMAAGTLLAGLLPAQAAVLGDALSYDLTVRGVGTFAVSLVDGSAHVRRIPRGRPRGEAAFHLAAEPLALAELLAGERRKVRRFGQAAKLSGRRKRMRALTALPVTRISLADAVRAGARLEPWLVYKALPHAIPPEWTRGHVFTVAQEIVELAPRAWYITARDGVRLTVAEHVAGAAADATVTMNRATFDRLLRGESVAGGELPVIRGDREAVMALKRWTELARGA